MKAAPGRAETAIREALAAGPTPGPWVALPEEDDRHYLRIRGGMLGCRFKIAAVHKPNLIPEVQDREDHESRANALLIAACNPEAITALLSHLSDLRAEVERLSRDARRYRFARLGSMTAMVIEAGGEVRNAGHRYRPHELAMEWAERIDAAIDTALAATEKGGGDV